LIEVVVGGRPDVADPGAGRSSDIAVPRSFQDTASVPEASRSRMIRCRSTAWDGSQVPWRHPTVHSVTIVEPATG
jgi:hypothetical protein